MTGALIYGSASNDMTGDTAMRETNGAYTANVNMANNNTAYSFKYLGGKKRARTKKSRRGKRKSLRKRR